MSSGWDRGGAPLFHAGRRPIAVWGQIAWRHAIGQAWLPLHLQPPRVAALALTSFFLHLRLRLPRALAQPSFFFTSGRFLQIGDEGVL